MTFHKSFFRVIACLGCSVLAAQNVQRPSNTIEMSGYDTAGSVLPANSTSTLLTLTLEGDTAGGNVFHALTSDPGVIVSLILPSGVEVTSTNSLGFTFTTLPDSTTVEIESIFGLPGTHTLIQVPAGQPSGAYSIKANAANVNTDSAIIVSYYPSSNVRAAVTTNSSAYKVGDTVVLSGLIFDSATPITGAIVTSGVSVPISLTSQTSVGNPQLVSQQSIGTNLTEYQYTFTLTNSGGAIQEVRAALATVPPNVNIVNDILLFGNVAANGTAVSFTNLTVQRDPSSSFDPSTLQWAVTGTGPVVSVNLLDSGSFDAATGDGIYTGTFVPSAPGDYTVLLSATGTSLAGNAFSRSATASFKVATQQLASFTGFGDTQQSTGIVTTANLNVVTAGVYRYTVNLRASNQKTVEARVVATLAAGTQHLTVTFSNSDIFGLGVSGPYELVNALLIFQGAKELIADSRLDAGPTAAYTLGSFAPALYFNGQNSAAGVITGAGPKFDLLRAQIGVYNATAGPCAWRADLTDAAGNFITSAQANGALTAGNNSVVLNFDGIRIAQAGSGPYAVRNATVDCGTNHAAASLLFTISGFTASQFTYVAPDFTLSLIGTDPSGTPGSSLVFHLQLASTGSFADDVVFNFAGLPTGATGTFSIPSIVRAGLTDATVATSSSLATGNYSFNVVYSSGTISKTLPLTLNIGQIAVAVSPATASLHANQTQQFTSSVTYTGNTAVTWSISPSSGTISNTGLYTSPNVITSQQSVTVTATSVADTTKSGSATVTLLPSTVVATPTFNPTPGTYVTPQTVSISTSTSGASIRYTTDGSTPSSSTGTLYSAPFTVSTTATINAIAYAGGLTDSAIGSATYTISPLVATPTFNLVSGTYASAQSVGIGTITSGASIRYTTDGSTPTSTTGTIYSSAISVASTATVKAVAYKTGMTDSDIGSASYTIVSSWYDGGWSNRKSVRVDHTKVSGLSSLANFPLLFSVTDVNLKSVSNGGSVGKSDGSDILFTASDGTTKLPHEIESYNPISGQLIAWVNLTALSPTGDTVIYIYYGNASAADQQNKNAVWDANFKAVYHLGSSLGADSTSNANTGTASSVTAATGEIGGAGSSNGGHIIAASSASLQITSALTVETWVNANVVTGNYYRMLSKLSSGPYNGYELLFDASGHPFLQLANNGSIAAAYGSTLNTSTWYHVVGTYDGVTLTTYVNGVAGTPATASGALGNSTATLSLFDATFTSAPLNGTLDEVRVSNVARTAGWIGTEYNNESSPSTFFAVGSGEVSTIVVTPTFSPAAGTYSSAQTVSIATSTSGASIRYTTDGSTPTSSMGTLYSSALTVSSTTTIKAVAYKTGLSDSAVASATYTIQPIVNTPGFNPVAGAYSSTQTVSISSTTSGASIRYTTDGSTPTSSSGTVYSSPITVSATTTIKAIAYASGMTDSAVATAVYTIALWYDTSWPNRKAIVVNHAKVAGTSDLTNFPMLFSVTDANLKTLANGGGVGKPDGTDILFTAGNGTTKLDYELESYNPAIGQVIAWIRVPSLFASADTSIYIYYGNATAADQQNKAGVWDSNFKAVYHLGSSLGADSTANANTGTVSSVSAVTGEIGGAGSSNGGHISAGNGSSLQIAGALTLETWVNGNAVTGYVRMLSKFSSGPYNGYELLFDASGNPYIQLANNGNIAAAFGSTVTAGTWYHVVGTYDGTTLTTYVNGVAGTPATASGALANTTAPLTLFDASFTSAPFNGALDEVRVSNVARSAGWIGTAYNNESSPSTFFSVGSGEASTVAAAPTFSPAAGTYSSTQTVSIATNTIGASIRYTIDGSTPTSSIGTLYSSSITVSSTTTIKAIAYKTGLTDSSVSSATYTIQLPVNTPTFSPAAGSYSSTQTVSISSSTSGASIRYTTDGSTPTSTTGTVYSAPITVSSTTTIKAIAYASGMTDSTVNTAVYTIVAWYDNSWPNRKAIIVNHAKIVGTSDLSNFPMLLSVTDPSLKTVANGGGVGKSDGTDLLFISGSGTTKLDYELESYNPSTGQVIAWIRIPSLSASADTSIYVYYGNATATDQQNKSGVWDSNFKAVYHLGSSLGADSTSNANAGTVSSVSAATGEIGGAGSSNGGHITTGNGTSLQITGALTLETWVNANSVNNYYRMLSKFSSGPYNGYELLFDPSGRPYLQLANNGSIAAVYGSTLNTGTWYHVVGTYDGATMTTFVNGVAGTPATVSGAIANTSAGLSLFDATFTSSPLNGVLDEVRVSNVARSAGWIGTEYNNESSPSTFFSVSSGEASTVVAFPTFSPSAGTYTSTQTVTIATNTIGASIRYTTDGSTPTSSTGTLYSSAVTVSSTTTIKAIAYKTGLTDSSVSNATFTIQQPVNTPTFNPAAGSYSSTQSVSISTSTSGAAIRYTIDGSTPTSTTGTVYSAPISVSSTTTIKAIAYATGMTDSAVVTGVYTIVSWYDTSWSNRKAITINHSKIAGTSDLSNFPMLFSVTDANLKTVTNGGSVGKSDGTDILFTAGNGTTKLDYELESYNPSTGQVVAWVRIPSLVASADTSIYIYYGNASAADQQNKTGVWVSNFKAVYHLASSLGADSTSNANTGTVTSVSAATGEIGGAGSSNGGHIAAGNGASLQITAALTLQTWVNGNAVTGGYLRMVSKFSSGPYNGYELLFDPNGHPYLQLANNGNISAVYGSTVSAGTWYHVVGTYDGSTMTTYVNGVAGTPATVTGAIANTAAALSLFDATFTSAPLNGVLDEVRVSNVARSAGWIGTEFNNESSPSTFFSVGGAENHP
jgi:hypothetical protein